MNTFLEDEYPKASRYEFPFAIWVFNCEKNNGLFPVTLTDTTSFSFSYSAFAQRGLGFLLETVSRREV